MPIQYRCRCGQEVTLRTRESVYLIAGAAVLFTLINTVLLVVVWNRLDDIDSGSGGNPHEFASGARSAESDRGASAELGSPSESAARDATVEIASTDRPLEHDPKSGWATSADATSSKEPIRLVGDAGTGSGADDESTDSEPATAKTDPALSASGSTEDGGSGDGGEPVGDRSGSAVPAVDQPSRPVVRLERPLDVDGLALWLALEALPADPGERAAVLVAGVAWGTGFVRELAERRLAEESGPLGSALQEWRSSRETDLSAGSGRKKSSRRPYVELPGELGAEVSNTWSELGERIAERGLAEDRDWAKRVRTALGDPSDRVLLVDLSESMEAEVALFADQLRTMLPLLDRPGGGQWGWIGFRDEVVDACELTGDLDLFLASLSQWRCEGGGDVPEGVDRAVFEALKFGRFEWSPQLDRRLLLFGDAPPPYDRINSVVSLMAAARRSPDGYGLHALGIVREPEFPRLPAFRELAEAGGGRAVLIAPDEPLGSPLWKLLVGDAAPDWRGTIAPSRGG